MLSVEFSLKQKPFAGEGGRLNNFANKNWQKHLVELAPVGNTVLWVNPQFSHLPFDLKVGKPSPLGLFFMSDFRDKPISLSEGVQAGECWKSHERSALLIRLLFADVKNSIYRDLDLKGIGYIKTVHNAKAVVHSSFLGRRHVNSGREGLLDKKTAFYDMEKSEKFNSLGIKTARSIAIIRLDNIIYEGQVMPFARLKRMKKIGGNFEPVIEVRAFGTKMRIENYLKSSIDEEELLLEDAKSLVACELGRETISDEEYIEWLVKTLGRNVGIMHKNGLYHKYLTTHNITLDCRVVDLDSGGEITSPGQRKDDCGRALTSLIPFVLSIVGEGYNPAIKHWIGAFYQSYHEAFPSSV